MRPLSSPTQAATATQQPNACRFFPPAQTISTMNKAAICIGHSLHIMNLRELLNRCAALFFGDFSARCEKFLFSLLFCCFCFRSHNLSLSPDLSPSSAHHRHQLNSRQQTRNQHRSRMSAAAAKVCVTCGVAGGDKYKCAQCKTAK